MTAPELLDTCNAKLWAEEFMRLFGERRQDIDEGLMIGWFANAMQAGEHHYRRKCDELQEQVVALQNRVEEIERNGSSDAHA